ncbi:MAG: TRAP transporter substrate-binding protein DctP [Verrucomicrobia bacterium]|nr:TRAP transporter substrate-binding protein DctP [Verrucomicrobiota bacterium]
MKQFRPTLLIAGILLAVATGSTAESVRIKFATLAPRDSSFHKTLLTMGDKWKQASGGAVTLTVYPDGTQGGEADMVRRMRVVQLHGAMLTVLGLSQVEESIGGLQLMPMMFHSLDEFDYVRDHLRPKLEKKLLDKGFVILFWGDAGWVRYFSRQPALMPDDFKKMKMFVWAGDTRSIEIYKTMGYNAVPLEQTDVLAGLQTGLIDCLSTIPFYALAGQFYGPAPHMLEINWVPLVGATVVTKKTWDAIPAAQKTAMLKAAAEAGEAIKQRSRVESDESVEAMKKRGLKVQPLTPEALAAWQKVGDEAYPRIRGKIVPTEMFDEVQSLLKEYRASQAKK